MKLPLYTSLWQIAIMPDITTKGEPCYMAYNLDIQGVMSHGFSVTEAYTNVLNATMEYEETNNF